MLKKVPSLSSWECACHFGLISEFCTRDISTFPDHPTRARSLLALT